jgi:hypothetical protein
MKFDVIIIGSGPNAGGMFVERLNRGVAGLLKKTYATRKEFTEATLDFLRDKVR